MVDVRRLEQALRKQVSGEVRFDAGARAAYSHDASNYRQVPLGLVLPRSVDDVVAALGVCREHGASILARGGGTAQCGQGVNVGVVIDCSKYLHRVLAVDLRRRRGRPDETSFFRHPLRLVRCRDRRRIARRGDRDRFSFQPGRRHREPPSLVQPAGQQQDRGGNDDHELLRHHESSGQRSSQGLRRSRSWRRRARRGGEQLRLRHCQASGTRQGRQQAGDEPVKLCLQDGVPVELRKQLMADLQYDTIGESVDFFRFKQDCAQRLAEIVKGYVDGGRANMPHEEAVRDLLLERSHVFDTADVTGAPWIEIDFPGDVARAAEEVLPQLLPVGIAQ